MLHAHIITPWVGWHLDVPQHLFWPVRVLSHCPLGKTRMKSDPKGHTRKNSWKQWCVGCNFQATKFFVWSRFVSLETSLKHQGHGTVWFVLKKWGKKWGSSSWTFQAKCETAVQKMTSLWWQQWWKLVLWWVRPVVWKLSLADDVVCQAGGQHPLKCNQQEDILFDKMIFSTMGEVNFANLNAAELSAFLRVTSIVLVEATERGHSGLALCHWVPAQDLTRMRFPGWPMSAHWMWFHCKWRQVQKSPVSLLPCSRLCCCEVDLLGSPLAMWQESASLEKVDDFQLHTLSGTHGHLLHPSQHSIHSFLPPFQPLDPNKAWIMQVHKMTAWWHFKNCEKITKSRHWQTAMDFKRQSSIHQTPGAEEGCDCWSIGPHHQCHQGATSAWCEKLDEFEDEANATLCMTLWLHMAWVAVSSCLLVTLQAARQAKNIKMLHHKLLWMEGAASANCTVAGDTNNPPATTIHWQQRDWCRMKSHWTLCRGHGQLHTSWCQQHWWPCCIGEGGNAMEKGTVLWVQAIQGEKGSKKQMEPRLKQGKLTTHFCTCWQCHTCGRMARTGHKGTQDHGKPSWLKAPFNNCWCKSQLCRGHADTADCVACAIRLQSRSNFF